MKTEIKSLVFEKMAEDGQGLARLASLTAIDHDGDTYAPGAFLGPDGGDQWVPIVPAHNRSATPLGKARIFEKDGYAYAEIHLNLETIGGKDWHSVLKFDLATGKPAQEWSYGFGVVDSQREEQNGKPVRRLKRLDVHEVSPVIRGAGADTATLSMKSRGAFADQIDQVITDLNDLVERAESVKATRAADGRQLGAERLAQLDELKARLEAVLETGQADPDDAEVKAQADGARLAAGFETRGARKRWANGAD
ncbi:HK97 family phage prohead protease [uncultured Maricaulis sp.]|uniref:HK97 family phage prohead protease n=1 Tax=uncultured Maricaulis sp. TaxID=174710 RepID=UPI0030D716E4|tara:strand:- start:137746 stop:138501 length:756 start_codon:yes stop_codon:yes gene_type:complete